MSDQVLLESGLRRQPLENSRIRVSDSGTLEIGGQPMAHEALARLCEMSAVPANFLPTLTAQTAAAVLREKFGLVERPVDAIVAPGEGILSFSWADVPYIPTADVLNTITDAGAGFDMTVVKERAGIRNFSIMVAQAGAFNVIGDDDVHFGVHYSGSVDGHVAPKIDLSFFRPICSNGAVITEGSWSLPRRLLKTLDVILPALAEAVGQVLSLSMAYGERLRGLAGVSIDDPADAFNALIHLQGLPAGMIGQLLDAYNKEPSPTLWGIMNALTRAANRDDVSLEHARRLWLSAGNVVIDGGVPCRICGTIIDNQRMHQH